MRVICPCCGLSVGLVEDEEVGAVIQDHAPAEDPEGICPLSGSSWPPADVWVGAMAMQHEGRVETLFLVLWADADTVLDRAKLMLERVRPEWAFYDLASFIPLDTLLEAMARLPGSAGVLLVKEADPFAAFIEGLDLDLGGNDDRAS